MSQSLIAVIASLGAVLIAVTDGPRSVRVGAMAAGLCMGAAASSVGGPAAAWALVGIGAGIGLLAAAAEGLARRLPVSRGLDPLVPVVAPRDKLFGPRSGRVFAAGVALLAASWLALNIEVGVAASGASGSIFAAADIWLVGVVRLLRARAVEDLAVGAVAVSLATACGWVLEVGPDALAEAAASTSLAAATAIAAGWLVGRHHSRDGAPAGSAPGGT